MSDNNKRNLLIIISECAIIELETSSISNAFYEYDLNSKKLTTILENFMNIGKAIKGLSDDFKLKNATLPWNEIMQFCLNCSGVYGLGPFGINKEHIWKIMKDHVFGWKNKAEKMLITL